MTDIKFTCHTCRLTTFAELGQSVYNGRLRWYISFVCEKCGDALEQDGGDFPPDELRAQILQDTGQWELVVEGNSDNKVKIAQIVHKTLKFPLTEALKISKRDPAIIYQGTEVEVKWIKEKFSDEGITEGVHSRRSES